MNFVLISQVPIDCVVTKWSDWSPHDNNGHSHRERYMTQPALNGGAECPVTYQTKLGIYGQLLFLADRLNCKLL